MDVRATSDFLSWIAELRIDAGPGYRVYYAQRGSVLTLLAGGDKSSQAKDIARATRLAKESRV
jgi:putative addiction module killer protein